MGSRYTKFSGYLATDSPEEVKKKQQQNAYAYVERAMDGVEGYELDSSYDEAKKKGILAVYDQYYKEHYSDLGMPTYAQQNGSSGSSGGFGGGGSGYSVYDPYSDDRYMEALNALKAAQSNLPIYANSYEDEIRDVYNKIVNREDFTYDVNADALYNQYKDQYVSLGKLAMQDTMGQAAAMTGGYGNSYAASVGNQAYQSYISQLNQIVPELYGMAYDRYRDEGQDLLNQYSMLGDMRDTEYNQYLNELNQYWNNVNYYKQLLDDAYNQGYTANRDAYNMYIDERNFAYQQQQDALAQQNYLNEFEYKKLQDALQQQNYEKEFEYQKWQDAIANDQWQQSFNHGVAQDALAQQNYENEFAYQQQQDALAQQNYQQEFQYQKQQDAIANSQWNQNFAYKQQQDALDRQQWQDEFDLDVYKTDLEQYNLEQERAAKHQEQMYEYLYDKLESGVPPTMEEFASAGIGEDEARQILGNYGFDVNTDGSTDGFSGTTYEEAMAYMRSHGVSNDVSSALMKKSEWASRKGSGTSGQDTQYDSYEEYLKAYVNSRIAGVGSITPSATVTTKSNKPSGGPHKPYTRVQLY